jgi:hypothetical protein
MHQTVQPESNRLAVLAAGIRAEHEATAMALKRGLAHAMAAGELLIEAKGLLKHGQWLPWLRDHCAISDRTARLYTRLANNRVQIEGQIGNVADLSVRAAIALIAPKNQSDLAPIVYAALESLKFPDFEQLRIERDKRKLAFVAASLALTKIMEIANKDAADAFWTALGEQLMSAIADCNHLLGKRSDIASSARATAATLKIENIASKMLSSVRSIAAGGRET